MINVKKGPAHSLYQSDFVGATKDGEGVVAGMLVRRDTDGSIVKGVSSAANAAKERLGFAINNQTDSDSLSSRKIAAYSLDGASVIGTDQVTGTLNAVNFPVGAEIAPDAANAGFVKIAGSGDRVIGEVDSVEEIFVGQKAVTLLYIKVRV